MRIVSWYSCGAASAVATKLAIKQYGKENMVIARCIVREEHPDNERFAADCEKWFGMPITNLIREKYDGSIISVMTKHGYIKGPRNVVCTFELKKRVRLDFEKPDDTNVFGYTAEEQDRWDRFLDANNGKAIAPLIDAGLEHSDCLAMIKNAGMELPAMYKLGYKHNNCIGCVKGGMGYFNKIRVDFPNEFERLAVLEEQLGATVFNGFTLRELDPSRGAYQEEPEIQCGIFCHMAEAELKEATYLATSTSLNSATS